MQKTFLYILLLLACQSCFLFPDPGPEPEKPTEETPLPEFNSGTLYPVEPGIIDEASGIVPSKSMPGNLWVIEDGLNLSALHLLSTQGVYEGRIELPLKNRDWEDLAAGPGPIAGKNYIYIGDFGDNFTQNNGGIIYRLEEPTSLSDTDLQIDAISYTYEADEPNINVEAHFIDPLTKDIYIIAKTDLFSFTPSKIFRLNYPYSDQENVAEYLGESPNYFTITAADISLDGQEIMLKNYGAIYYWRLKKDESIFEALTRKRDLGLPYYAALEPLGEAVCFDAQSSGYFTLSEIRNASKVSLHYYTRKVVDQ